MTTLKEMVVGFFENNKWHYSYARADDLIASHFSGRHGCWQFLVAVDADLVGFAFSIFPIKAPPERRVECAKLILGLNFKGKLGNFDLDMDDGEIRFRSPLVRSAEGFTAEIIEQGINYHLESMEDHFETILRVLYGKETAKKALKAPASEDTASEARFQCN